ncbi:hypothetical protein [Flavobacterium xinjiangense]|uniref:Uncharacterized protein n=1 Tax=Flavobacterium xinjiangense TaxID=178356 RepID=A0A1M7K790_9FLAO|nr:hypothetical protein [Flavobacterium xinjiangense]SHM61169.1 hypothetical protein SAMN05216269_105215 [Flavobacterium xinjiangense]
MNDKIDIFESIKSDAINELSPEILETGLDYLTDSEVLKDIPIFGIAFKSYNLYQRVTETFFIKKLLKFLFELREIPLLEREKFIKKLEINQETNKAGEKLLITINRLNDIDKAEIIGRLFKKTILGKIEFEDFSRLTHIIDNAYIHDLKLLKNNIYLRYVNDDIKSSLHQVGLLNQNISDVERQKRFLERVGSKSDVQPKFEYKVNQYCEILVEHGFKE